MGSLCRRPFYQTTLKIHCFSAQPGHPYLEATLYDFTVDTSRPDAYHLTLDPSRLDAYWGPVLISGSWGHKLRMFGDQATGWDTAARGHPRGR